MTDTENKPFLVKVPFRCARKQKDFDVEVPLETAQKMAEIQTAKSDASEALPAAVEAFIEEHGVMPDFLCYYRGQLVILPNVHHSNDDAVKRSLNAAIGEDKFEVPPPEKRGPRKAKDGAEASSETPAE